jgi:plasmid stabilization system protein ParE
LRIKLEKAAKLDLLAIKDYYRDVGGNPLAVRMVRLIKSDIFSLLDYAAPPYEMAAGIRRLVVANGAYLVFHRVTKSSIEILHIRRSERAPATEKDME